MVCPFPHLVFVFASPPSELTACAGPGYGEFRTDTESIFERMSRARARSSAVVDHGNPAAWPFEHWIEQSPNVVIASVYYRLDSIGFLTAPEFADDASLGDVNAGFLE